MSQLSELSHALRKCYQNAGILHDLPFTLEKEIVLNSLVLNYSDLCNPVEINCLCRFLSGNEAVNSIETLIIISKPVGGASRKADAQVSNAHGPYNAEDHGSTGFPDKLLKAAILFIANSLKLHTVIIDSVRIKVELLSILGEALSTTKSVVRWLSFKSLNIGSSGIKVLGPHISKMQIQVLVFERCGLGDDSCPHLSQILKSQEAVLDSSFWNTTLRSDCTVIRSNVNKREKEESDLVFSQGLVALSLMGNKISDKGLGFLRRAIHSNHWLLGLNLARNKLEKGGINLLAIALKTGNNALHTILLHGNPGLTIEDTSTLRESCFSSPSRLDLMPKGVSMLLKRWMSLQSAENGNIEQSLNNSNKQDEKISSNINGINIEKKTLKHNVKSVISREQNGIKPPVNIDSEYQDFKNGFESHETLKKILEEESHLDVDQSWLDEDEEVEKEEVENWKEMKAREVGFKEEIENDLYMGSEDDDDSEALSIDVVAGRQVNRYMMAAADPRNIDQRDNYQIQDIDEYRPPSRQSLKPRSQSLITAFASGSGLSSVVKDTVQHPESVYQSYVTDVEHWIGSPGHGHGHDLVQRPTWLSTNRNETLLDSRPSSAPGTRRGITGVTAGAFMSRSNVNRLEQFNSLEAFGCKNISPNNIAAKSRLLKLQQESSAMPLRRHSVDGIHFTQKLRSRSNCKNSSFSVRRQEEMSRRLTTGESTARPGHLLSAMRNKPMTLRQRSHSIFTGVGTSIGKDKDGQTSMRRPYGNWCVSHSSDGAFARNSPKGFHMNELDGGGEMDIRNRHKQQHNFFKEEVISSNRKSRIKSNNQGKWKGNKITASEDEKRIKTNGFNQEHKSLDSILGQFKESVTGINKSLDDVSAQLKNVSTSLNESVLERTPGSFRSQSNSEMQSIVSCPSSAQVKKSERSNVRTSLSHSATTAFIDDDSIDISATLGSPQHHASHMISDFTNNRVTIKVPNPNTPSTTVPINDTSSSLDVLGQTLGRTRGSLIRRTNDEDTIHDHYYEIENNSEKRKTWRSPVTHRDPRSLGHDRDGREIGRDSSSPSHHKIVTGSGLGSDVGVDRSMVLRDDENDNYFEDRHGSNNMKSPSCSSSSSPDSHFTRSQRSKEGKKIIDIENDSERGINKERGRGKESGGGSESESDKIITQSGISLLIRDRLRSKLESILRPNLK